MRIAIYKDTLTIKGGGSAAIIELANRLNADIITAGYNRDITRWLQINNSVIDIGNFTLKFNHPLGYLIESPLRFFFNKRKFDYDIHIFTGSFSFLTAKKNNTNIWLCFTPNRLLYDLKEWKINGASLPKKIFLIPYINILTLFDQYFVKNRIKRIVSQTETVRKRVKKYYSLNSRIIHTSIVFSKYKFREFGNYYLAVGRLVPEKRMDLIVEAFKKMPEKNLIIVGDGPLRNSLKNKISSYKNIRLDTNVNDEKLIRYYSQCLATIYMPINEDFGLVPVESMASGKICIAANEGGCKETIENNKTGFLIDPKTNTIIETVKEFNISKAQSMKNNCLKRAKKFDINEISKQWNSFLKEV